MKRIYSAAVLFICMFFISCLSAPQLSLEKKADFTTNGFLDEHHYQVTASAAPDSSAKGLVAQRESAMLRARNGLQASAVKALTEYRLSSYTASLKSNPNKEKMMTEARAFTSAEFQKYLAYGKIEEEYYEKDNSAAVVYRITKNNLKKEIESFTIETESAKKEESK